MRNTFSQEEIAWLKENYPRDESREETYARYLGAFGDKRSMSGVVTYCKRHGIHKPMRQFKKGNRPWSEGLSKEEHKAHFSADSYAKMTSQCENFGNVKAHRMMNVPNGYRVHNLGNGEKLVMREDIWKCMQAAGFLGQGELTKAVYEIYLVKRKVERMTGKSVRRLTDRQSPEYMGKIREMAAAKKRIAIVAEKGGEERRFASMSEASRELGITVSLVCRALNGQRSHTHGWRFEKVEEKE